MPGIPADRTTPVQQRLTVHGPNAVSIGWNTYEKIKKPCVQYGLLPELMLLRECSDSSITYPTSRTYSNVVTLSNLLPAVTYYYKIESKNSTVQQFLSPRLAGDRSPFSVAAVIDMGVYGADGFTIASNPAKRREPVPKIEPELNHTTIWQLAQSVNNYEFILHPGDFAYADNFANVFGLQSNPANAYETILEQFFEQLAPISGRKFYMAGPGNHDADCVENSDPQDSCPVGQTNFTDYVNRWGRMTPSAFPSRSFFPTASTNSRKAVTLAKTPFWYSFDYGMVHFIMINTETDFPNAPDVALGGPFGFPNQQLEFIKADLASVDRTITPWVVLGGHRAWYSTGGNGNICSSCQEAFEELMYTYGVDLAIFGHVHNSQRFLPVYNSTADPKGMNDPKAPMYIVAGGAGNIEGTAAVGSNVSFNTFAYADDFSFATIHFQDAHHLRVDFIRSSTGEVLDSSTLYKSHKQQFVVQKPPKSS
ncbi:Metallo-dependent phosphatase-like protein [Xylogone sp. PMI_703]|nr:Metallo-dependent phosphatase-like protein [Xylogone sp. PMI_703]